MTLGVHGCALSANKTGTLHHFIRTVRVPVDEQNKQLDLAKFDQAQTVVHWVLTGILVPISKRKEFPIAGGRC